MGYLLDEQALTLERYLVSSVSSGQSSHINKVATRNAWHIEEDLKMLEVKKLMSLRNKFDSSLESPISNRMQLPVYTTT